MRLPGIFLVAVLACVGRTSAQAGDFEVGARASVVTAGGEPANDIISAGIFGKYHFTEQWILGFSLDSAAYDFEKPADLLGLQPAGGSAVDAGTDSILLAAWIERQYTKPESRLAWFWSAGLGVASPDVEDVSGPLQGGGTFEITTDAGTEILLSGSGGLLLSFGKRWVADFALRADHHVADWEVRDSVSGRSDSLGSYTGLGAHAGLAFRF